MGAQVHGQEDIIRERLTRDHCGACGASRSHDDILVLAHRSSHWLMLVVCWRCQHRGIFIASFPGDRLAPTTEHLSLDPRHPLLDPSLDAQLPAPPPPTIVPLPPTDPQNAQITCGDVERMRQFLRGFNGDFHALFGGEAG